MIGFAIAKNSQKTIEQNQLHETEIYTRFLPETSVVNIIDCIILSHLVVTTYLGIT